MKRIIFQLFIFLFVIELSAQFTDDFERYNYSQRISTQSLNWITWSEDPVAGTGYIIDEDGIISNTDFPNYGETAHFAFSGEQAMFIGKNKLGTVPQDVVLNLQNKTTGIWNLSWKMYIPNKRKKAYYNFQEFTPINGSGNWAIQVYFNGRGKGVIKDDRGSALVKFTYPWKEWFELKHTIDLDNDTINIELITNSSTTEIYNSSFLSNNKKLGGVDFYANGKKNKYYIDDVVFEKNANSNELFIWDNNRWEDNLGNPQAGSPDTSYNVIIRDTYDVNAGTTLKSLNLVIEGAGNLKVSKGANVIVSGDLTVNTTNNKIIIEDGGSFVMLNNTANINLADSNVFEYVRKSTVLADKYDYTYWSSPINGNKVSNFGNSTVYTYNTANYIDWYSGNGYPQTSGTPDQYDDNGDDWLFANSSDNIIQAKGYAVLSDGNTSNQSVSFKGIPNNGYISLPVNLSGDDLNPDDDWNLIGNPYPSAIDARILINSNINLSGTLYFWTHNTNLGGGNNFGPADMNYDTNDYASFNLSGGVAAVSGGEIPNGYIASGQGFFMEVNNTGVITFNNDMRVINLLDENTQFFKSTKKKSKIVNNEASYNENKIWLNFTSKKGAFSQSLIAFSPNATNGYEPNYDGVRADADLKSKFYSILGNKELAIQGRSELEENQQIHLGFYITSPDSFTISIKKLEGLLINDQMNIYLKDSELGRMHNLKMSDYHFNVSKKGTNNSRFTLQFETNALDPAKFIKENSFILVNEEDRFNIISNQKVVEIKLYDILGRLLLDDYPNSNNFYIDNASIANGSIVIVKAKLKNGKLINKKIIKY